MINDESFKTLIFFKKCVYPHLVYIFRKLHFISAVYNRAYVSF